MAWPFPSGFRCRSSRPSHGAFESWAEAELALGRHTRVVEGIYELARRHPFHERLLSTQMPALYRSGRPAEALAQYEAMRQLLARELGLEPSPVLAGLYASLLSSDGETEPLHRCPAHVWTQMRATAVHAPAPAEPARLQLSCGLMDFTGRRSATAELLDVLGDAANGYG
ncbi:AfsR/SARP family transcriptional regulator [Streptomyces inhibens]|uniref:AfsR/SARP family transcriptional regulator n=1 Tax=Streptomyces inhibens TaxID=2293571 RepID=UPI001EE6DE31|nr:BTAD domain-containing putative transcriptional regulator [Streptomyces inhibens]UKY48184.1 hypothetical protein KI385_04750 [Streptomyces inhibens]